MDNNNVATGAVVILLLIGGTLVCVFWIGGYETLDVNEFGLKQNTFTKEIEGETLKGGGLRWVGIQYDFVRFPATWQTVEFTPSEEADDIPINTQTRDGLAITFDASFQYILLKESVLSIFLNFSNNYNAQIVQVARGALRNVASLYSAAEFLQDRNNVTEAMRLGIVASLEDMHVNIDYFQLRAIELPVSFMDATEAVETARMLKQIAQYELEAAVISAQISVVEAQAAANVSLIEAYAAANVSVIEARAQADALNISMSMEAMTIADFMNITGMNETQVIAYFYVQALQNLPEGTTLVIGDFQDILIGA